MVQINLAWNVDKRTLNEIDMNRFSFFAYFSLNKECSFCEKYISDKPSWLTVIEYK